jgi:hypothetical protein
MKALKVKKHSLDYDANGTVNLRYVMAQRFKKNGYTHVQLKNKIYSAHVMSWIVWVDVN